MSFDMFDDEEKKVEYKEKKEENPITGEETYKKETKVKEKDDDSII